MLLIHDDYVYNTLLTIKLGQSFNLKITVWTMRGPSFANLKDKRGPKERPPGPVGYHHPPPPPSPVISKDPFQVI